jgi:DNA-directed RNA polymerase subunit beta
LLGHGATHTLREILTVKSDDLIGRSAMYDSIIKGKNFILPNIPESFNVMLNMLRGLSLNISFGLNEENRLKAEKAAEDSEDTGDTGNAEEKVDMEVKAPEDTNEDVVVSKEENSDEVLVESSEKNN